MTATRLELELTDSWAYGAGVLHGGWLLDTIATAALEHSAHPHPLAVSAHYVAAPRVGPAVLEVEPLREGRSVGSLLARLSQEGAPKVEVLLSAGTLPAVEDCLLSKMPEGLPRNGITENLDVRLDPATAGWARGAPGGSAQIAGYVRSATGRAVDPLFLLCVADALPPVTLDLGIPGWVPTVELTVHVRAVPVDGWLRVVQRARLVSGGWLDEECEVWDSSGALVAQARQLAAYREGRA